MFQRGRLEIPKLYNAMQCNISEAPSLCDQVKLSIKNTEAGVQPESPRAPSLLCIRLVIFVIAAVEPHRDLPLVKAARRCPSVLPGSLSTYSHILQIYSFLTVNLKLVHLLAWYLEIIVAMFRAQQNAFDDAVGRLFHQEALGSH